MAWPAQHVANSALARDEPVPSQSGTTARRAQPGDAAGNSVAAKPRSGNWRLTASSLRRRSWVVAQGDSLAAPVRHFRIGCRPCSVTRKNPIDISNLLRESVFRKARVARLGQVPIWCTHRRGVAPQSGNRHAGLAEVSRGPVARTGHLAGGRDLRPINRFGCRPEASVVSPKGSHRPRSRGC